MYVTGLCGVFDCLRPRACIKNAKATVAGDVRH